MPAKIFSMQAREDGSARLALKLKLAGRSGIERISCDVPPDGLVQLVLFSEALCLRSAAGLPAAAEVAFDGLVLSFDPARQDILVERQAGYSQQTARLPVGSFLAEMAAMTEICIARAETSKHGQALKELLAGCPAPEGLEALAGKDDAEQALHHLHEIALLLLVQETAARGSALARMLRGKKSRDQAAGAVRSLLHGLAAELVAEPAPLSASPLHSA